MRQTFRSRDLSNCLMTDLSSPYPPGLKYFPGSLSIRMTMRKTRTVCLRAGAESARSHFLRCGRFWTGGCLRMRPKRGKIAGMPRTMKDRVRDLTPRHREVVRLVSLGCSQLEIAAILNLHPNTIDAHKQAAMRTLGVGKATLLTRLAIQHRISSLKDQLTRSEKRKIARRK